MHRKFAKILKTQIFFKNNLKNNALFAIFNKNTCININLFNKNRKNKIKNLRVLNQAKLVTFLIEST